MWVQLTENLLLTKIADQELAAYKEALTTPQTGNPVGAVLAETATMIRGAVALKNKLNTGDAYIPNSLTWAATDIAAYTMLRRSGGAIVDPQGARKEAYDAAMELLAKVTRGEVAVEAPDNPDSGQWGTFVPSFNRCKSHPFRQWTAPRQRGLT